MMRFRFLLAVALAMCLASSAMAVDFTWQGINTEVSTGLGNGNVDDSTLWLDATTEPPDNSLVPGAGDSATFNQDDQPAVNPVGKSDNYNKEIVIKAGATFAPDLMTISRGDWRGPWTPFYIQQNLTLDKLFVNHHNNAAGQLVRVGTDDTGTGFAERRGWLMGAPTIPTTGTVNIEGNTGNKDYDLSLYANVAALIAAVNADTATTGVTASDPAGTPTIGLYSETAGSTQYVKVTRTPPYTTGLDGQPGVATVDDDGDAYWDPGPDLQPGVAGVDDDGNTIVDDAVELGFLGSDDVRMNIDEAAGELGWYGSDDVAIFPVIHYARVVEEDAVAFYGLDAAETTLTLSGADPVAVTGLTGWNNFYVANNSHLAFSNVNCLINTAMTGSISGATTGSVDFTATGQTGSDVISVTGLAVSAPLLRIRSDQVWGTSYIIHNMSANQPMVTSLDGPTLNNLDEVSFYLAGQIADHTYYIPGGEFRAIHTYGSGTSGKTNTWSVQGDISLKGVAQGSAAYTDVPGDYSLMVTTGQRNYSILDLNDNNLTTANGVLLARVGGAYTVTDTQSYTRLIDATKTTAGDGSTLAIGGNLVYNANQQQAGFLDTAGALRETRTTGISGDATTVINLQGSFTSNVRALSTAGLSLSTVNLLGGEVAGTPKTWEVTGDVASTTFGNGTGAIGTMNIGAVGDEASIQLVNDKLNDNDPANVAKVKEGELLLVSKLNIVNGTLNLKGNAVLVSNASLSIGADGTLDLAAGVDQSPGTPYAKFAGLGDQTGEGGWGDFQNKVVDTSTTANQDLTFQPYYDAVANKTYWQPVGEATGIVSATSGVAVNPTTLPVGYNATLVISVVDTGGFAITGLTNANFLISGVSVIGTVTETVPGVSGVYTATLSHNVAEVATVSVTVSGTALTTQPPVDFDFDPATDFATYNWLGVNTTTAAAMSQTNTDDPSLWMNASNSTTGQLPLANARAVFSFSATTNTYRDELFVLPGSDLTPGAMTVSSAAYNSAHVPLYILKDMMLVNLHNNWGGSSGSLGTEYCRIGDAVGSGGWMRIASATGVAGTITIKSDMDPVGTTTVDLTSMSLAAIATEINTYTSTTGVSAYVAQWWQAFPASLIIQRDQIGAGKYVEIVPSGNFPMTRWGGAVTRGDGWDPANVTMTVTGATDPLSFAGSTGTWYSIRLGAGSKIELTNSAITFNQLPQNLWNNIGTSRSGIGGSGGSLEFTAESGSVTLPDPGNRPEGAIGMGIHQLKVRSDQTWTNPTGLGVVRQTLANGVTMVQSIDGPALNNLDEVPFYVSLAYGNFTWSIDTGEYQALKASGDSTSGSTNILQLIGDVAFKGYAVTSGSAFGPVPASPDPDNGLVLNSTRRQAFVFDLNEFDLNVTHSVLLTDPYATSDGTYDREPGNSRYIDASNSTMTIGGDLVLASALNNAGYSGWTVGPDGQRGVALFDDDGNTIIDDAPELGWPGTDDVQVFFEHSQMGITGDATTVINLQGSFTTNLRSMSAAYNGLTLSTVNLLGGEVADLAETWEVTADPLTANFAPGFGSIGTLNIGGAGDEASIMLVNDSLNDNDPSNLVKAKDGEILLVGTLNIVNGKLDCNGLGVLVGSATLSISAEGTLDLHTGTTLSEGMVYGGFAGVGDQAAAWNAFKTRVVDSTPGNDALTFQAVYVAGDNLTYWQVPGGGLPELAITASADFPWVYQNTAVTTIDRQKSVLTVNITGGSAPSETYAITVTENGGAVANFQVTQPVAIVAGTPQAVDVLGGRRATTTAAGYTLNVTVTGTPGAQTATVNVPLALRLLADIDGDGSVTAADKLEMNKNLNGLATLPGIGLRELDLTGDGATVNAEDKLVINQVLNGLIVP